MPATPKNIIDFLTDLGVSPFALAELAFLSCFITFFLLTLADYRDRVANRSQDWNTWKHRKLSAYVQDWHASSDSAN